MQLTVVTRFHCSVTLSQIQCLVRSEMSLFLKYYCSGHLCTLGFAIIECYIALASYLGPGKGPGIYCLHMRRHPTFLWGIGNYSNLVRVS